jgi:endo-1,4-beta-xylanase
MNGRSQDSLRFWAEKLGKNIGASVEGYFFLNNFWTMTTKTYHKILNGQFNMTVAGNEMKFDATEPQRNVFDFTKGDILVEYAENFNMDVRGHCLIWHQQLPGWIMAGLTDGVNNGLYTRDTLLAIMKNHITTIVGHWKGKIKEWDVVNEVFNENGSLRASIWQQVIGNDFIDSAFVWAHQADPDALLFLLDYGAEAKNNKSDSLYKKVKELVEKGIPIHGVGMQCHLTLNSINFFSIEQNIKRLTDLGLQVSITELDIKIPADLFSTEAALNDQAKNYGQLLSMFLKCEQCPSFVMWAFSDNDSWIPEHTNGEYGQACIYNAKYQPKPAYYALLDTLKAWNGVHVAVNNNSYSPVSIFPTVIDDYFIIYSENNCCEFTEAFITDLTGRYIMNIQSVKSGEPIRLNLTARGMYLLTLVDNSGKPYMLKFFKK